MFFGCADGRASGRERRCGVLDLFRFSGSAERTIGTEIVDIIHNPAMGIDYASSLAYAGINLCDLRKTCGEESARLLFESFGVRAFFPYAFMLRVLQEVKADAVVVTHTSARAEKAALYAAKNAGVKVFAIEDLLGASLTFSPFLDLFPCDQRQFELLKQKGVPGDNIKPSVQRDWVQHVSTTPLMGLGDGGLLGRSKYFADYVIAGFSVAKKNLGRIGYKDEQIMMFGLPAFNSLYQSLSTRRCEDGGHLSRDRFRILVTSQAPYTRDHIEFLQLVINLASIFADAEVLVKPHPSSGGLLERTMLEESTAKNIQIVDGDFQKLLSSASCLVTEYSTTGLEAVCYGVAVVAYQKTGETPVPFNGIDGVTVARNFSQLLSALRDIADGEHTCVPERTQQIIENTSHLRLNTSVMSLYCLLWTVSLPILIKGHWCSDYGKR